MWHCFSSFGTFGREALWRSGAWRVGRSALVECAEFAAVEDVMMDDTCSWLWSCAAIEDNEQASRLLMEDVNLFFLSARIRDFISKASITSPPVTPNTVGRCDLKCSLRQFLLWFPFLYMHLMSSIAIVYTHIDSLSVLPEVLYLSTVNVFSRNSIQEAQDEWNAW